MHRRFKLICYTSVKNAMKRSLLFLFLIPLALARFAFAGDIPCDSSNAGRTCGQSSYPYYISISSQCALGGTAQGRGSQYCTSSGGVGGTNLNNYYASSYSQQSLPSFPTGDASYNYSFSGQIYGTLSVSATNGSTGAIGGLSATAGGGCQQSAYGSTYGGANQGGALTETVSHICGEDNGYSGQWAAGTATFTAYRYVTACYTTAETSDYPNPTSYSAGNGTCTPNHIPAGTITVESEDVITSAALSGSWTVSGAATIAGSGTQTNSNEPTGQYSISAGSAPNGYDANPTITPSTGSLTDGGTLTFVIGWKKSKASPPSCTANTTTATTGVSITFTATGGAGGNTWSASGGNPSSGSGSTFSTSFASAGSQSATVTDSDNNVVQCPSVSITSAGPVTGSISASPNSCTVSNGVCSSNISWSTNNVPSGDNVNVYVYIPSSGPNSETPMTGGSSGSTSAPWITTSGDTFVLKYCDSSNNNCVQLDTVTVTGVAPAAVTSVSASCSPSSIYTNGTSNCSATVYGTGSYSSLYTWSLVSGGGTLSSAGLYTPPNYATTATIKATSNGDATKSGTATISVSVPTPNAVTSVSASCSPSSIYTNGTSNCSATVYGTGSYSSLYTWSLVSGGGTLSSAGLYTPPNYATTATIKATSNGDATKSGTATISVSVPTPNAVTSVSASCSPSSIYTNGTSNCSATVYGTGSYSSLYTWSLVSGGGTLSSAGLYTPPNYATTATIKATSNGDATKSGTATISVSVPTPNAVTSVSASCSPSSIYTNGTSNCSATVYGTGSYSSLYTWSLVSGGGTLSSAGLYTPPNYATTATIKATSNGDATKSGTATISVTVPVTITFVTPTCSPSSVPTNGTTTCIAAVFGTGGYSTLVTWFIVSGGGSINSSGVYTAGSSPTTATIKATSVGDATKSGTATVSVAPSATITSVTPSCSPSSVPTNGTSTCTAVVAGTGSYSSAVTWSVVSGGGSINSSGVYMAGSSPTTATIKATSVGDATKSGTSNITIAAPATCTFSASPSVVVAPGNSTLQWNCQGATSCTLNNQAVNASGGTQTVAPTATTSYTLSCLNSVSAVTNTVTTVSVSTSPGTQETTP